MYKSYKFRLYPNDKQKELIHKTFGCTRLVYNRCLEKCKKDGFRSSFDLCVYLKQLEKEYDFLKDVDSCALRCSIFNLEDSYKNFFSKRANYPKFKSKFYRQSYRTNCIRSSYKGTNYSNIELDLINKTIKLPKIKKVKISGYRNLKEISSKIINATISYEKTGKYYVSVVVEELDIVKEHVTPTSIVGIDLGIKDLVITSDGEKYNNPKELVKREKQLKRLQRKLSRQIKGSKNYIKTKLRIARVYSKISNSRKHNIISIVNKLVKENDIIVSEKLRVTNMIKNHKLAKSITDACFNKICNLLDWKTKKEGKYYYQVNTFYPSSKTCNHCGYKTNVTNNLRVRKWECPSCNNINDRDINASINIAFEGLKLHYQN